MQCENPGMLSAIFVLGGVSIAATAVTVAEQAASAARLKEFGVVATHWTSTDCADSFSVNSSSFPVGSVLSVACGVLLGGIAVLCLLLPSRCPRCIGCINVGTPAMKVKLMRAAADGHFGVVNHVMLVLSTYLMLVTAAIQLSFIPLLGGGSQWNEACLPNTQCQDAVNAAFNRTGGPSVCCSSFTLASSCGDGFLFWGAIGAVTIMPLLPLPLVLWRINTILEGSPASNP